MTFVGFHASHEQLHPSVLLAAVQRAEELGFDGAMCSDHLAPWSERQGHSAYAWSWLGAALATTRFSFGVVSAPGQRYHPAIAAQAIGTLGAMFPGRFWAALGSGENMNEHVTGDPWPEKPERNARLRESVDVIRALLAGEEVDHDGHIRVHRARVWTRPDVAPPLMAAAVSPETAAWAAEWGDGLATVAQPPEALRKIVDAYRGAGGTGPLTLQVHLSWAETESEALAVANDQWRNGLIGPPEAWDWDDPKDFDRATEGADPEEVRGPVIVSADPQVHLERIAELVEIGFDRVYLHQVAPDQERFLEVFGQHVLPALKEVGA